MSEKYRYQLLTLCETLHEECTGTGSGNIQYDQIVEYYEFLQYRLKCWEPNCGNALRNQVEDAIKDLVSAILVESSGTYMEAKLFLTNECKGETSAQE